MKTVKHFFISFLIVLFFSPSLFGQKFSIGISAGPSFFTQKAEDEDRVWGEPLFITRLFFQGDLTFQFSEDIALKFNVAYQQKGFIRKEPTNFGFAFNKNKFNYFSVPILLELSRGEKIKYKAQIGFSFEYLLKSEHIRQREFDLYYSDRTKRYDRKYLSAVFGLSAELPLSDKFSVELGGRFSQGMLTLQKENSWVMFRHSGINSFAGLRYKF